MYTVIDNMHGWRDTLKKARVENNELIDEEGEPIYFLAVDREPKRNILLTYGGPGLRLFRTNDPQWFRLYGYWWNEECEEDVWLPNIAPILNRLLSQ
jgi:hypothetical protein